MAVLLTLTLYFFVPLVMASEAPVETYDELRPFVESVRDHPELFWSGDEGIRESALHATKFVFDKGARIYEIPA